ncbi:MAG: hypothetical protein U0Z44_21460 [Kouleothrix sp.]
MIHAVDAHVPVTLVANGVDTSAFRVAPIADGGPLRLICVARLIERKGQHHLIEALATPARQRRGRDARPDRHRRRRGNLPQAGRGGRAGRASALRGLCAARADRRAPAQRRTPLCCPRTTRA